MKEKTKQSAGGKAVENSLKSYYKEVKKVDNVVNCIVIFMAINIVHRRCFACN